MIKIPNCLENVFQDDITEKTVPIWSHHTLFAWFTWPRRGRLPSLSAGDGRESGPGTAPRGPPSPPSSRPAPSPPSPPSASPPPTPPTVSSSSRTWSRSKTPFLQAKRNKWEWYIIFYDRKNLSYIFTEKTLRNLDKYMKWIDILLGIVSLFTNCVRLKRHFPFDCQAAE